MKELIAGFVGLVLGVVIMGMAISGAKAESLLTCEAEVETYRKIIVDSLNLVEAKGGEQ
jgi:hypothetical protein